MFKLLLASILYVSTLFYPYRDFDCRNDYLADVAAITGDSTAGIIEAGCEVIAPYYEAR